MAIFDVHTLDAVYDPGKGMVSLVVLGYVTVIVYGYLITAVGVRVLVLKEWDGLLRLCNPFCCGAQLAVWQRRTLLEDM